MKNLLIIVLVFFISLKSFSQYPITQGLGSSNTLVRVPPDGGFQGSLINRNYLDTTAANLTPIRFYPGAMIYTTSDNKIWIRYFPAVAWININGGGGGGGGFLTANNGLTASTATNVQFGGAMTKDDTLLTTNAPYKFSIRKTSIRTDGFVVSLDETGNGNGPGIVNLDAQGYQQIGFKYVGQDPGFVRNQVENTLTPAIVNASGLPGLAYNLAGVGFTARFTSSGMISQYFQAVQGNVFCDSCLMIRNTGAGIQFAADNNGYFWFKGSPFNLTSVYGGFAPGGNMGIGTTAPNVKLTVANGQIRVAGINNASIFDSVVVINDGVLEARLASSIISSTPTWEATLIAQGTTPFAASRRVDIGGFDFSLDSLGKFKIRHKENVYDTAFTVGTGSTPGFSVIRTNDNEYLKTVANSFMSQNFSTVVGVGSSFNGQSVNFAGNSVVGPYQQPLDIVVSYPSIAGRGVKIRNDTLSTALFPFPDSTAYSPLEIYYTNHNNGNASLKFNVRADGHLFAKFLDAAPGMKAVRYNTTTGEFTTADTTTGGGSTPTLQQVLTAGSSITTSPSQTITGTGSNGLSFTSFDSYSFSASGNSHFGGSGIYNFDNRLQINDSLQFVGATGFHSADDSMLVWNANRKTVGYRPIPSGGGITIGTTTITSGTTTRILFDNAGVVGEYTTTGTGTVVAMQTSPTFVTPILGTPTSGTLTNATGYLWNNLTNPTGDLALTFDAGESSTFTNSNTTEDLLTMNSSTMTTSSMLSVNSTSTALAAGNNLAELIMSGANGSSAITATAIVATVTNTNATSGTNRAAFFTASGATTANIALQTGGGNVLIGSPTNNTVDALIIQSPTNTIGQGLRVYANNNSTYTELGFGGILNPGAFIIQSGSGTTLNLVGGKVFVGGGTSPTAMLHLLAGTTAATTAPLKLTTGSLMTTAEVGAVEYNNAFYATTNAINRIGIGGIIADFTSDVNNGTTVETDLYTYTTKASTLAATGEKLIAQFAGTFNDITSTGQLQCYFGGTNIGNTGALTIGATGAWVINITVIRTGATTARASVNVSTPSGSTALYTAETDITSLTFTNTQIIKCTGTAGGAGGGSNDITAKLGWIQWHPAANN